MNAAAGYASRMPARSQRPWPRRSRPTKQLAARWARAAAATHCLGSIGTGLPAAWRISTNGRLAAVRSLNSFSRSSSDNRLLVLGLNAYHGDVSAALVRDGMLVAAIEEERFRRVKHWAGFPSEAMRQC